MSEFLALITAFPTALFTVLMGVALLYWLMVILGALDIDILDADGAFEGADGAAEGAAEGALEGAVEGAAEGAAEGALEGAADGAADGVADGAADGTEGASGGLGGVLEALRLRNAPITVVFSMIVFFGWVLSMVGTAYLRPLLSALPAWLLNTLLMVLSLLLGMLLASLASRPLRGVFRGQQGAGRSSLIGKVVLVDTGSVDERFGQARFDEEGTAHLVQIRCDVAGLKRGDKALVVTYDKAKQAFIVEPYNDILGR
jgi:hypothetical protein